MRLKITIDLSEPAMADASSLHFALTQVSLKLIAHFGLDKPIAHENWGEVTDSQDSIVGDWEVITK